MTECGEGRLLGPLKPAEWRGVMVSSFGVIPKGSTGRWGLIVDLSSPEGASVNDSIEPGLCTQSYCGVEDATKEVMRLGRNAVLAKVGISR